MARKKFIMTNESADRTGIVAALTACLASHGGFITELSQFGTPSSERFYSRIAFHISDNKVADFKAEMKNVSADFTLRTRIIPAKRKTKTLIMVSKFDHCLADLIYRVGKGRLNCEIVGVVSNHMEAKPLADAAGLSYHHIPVTKDTKPEAEAALRELASETGTELIPRALHANPVRQSLQRIFWPDYKYSPFIFAEF